MDLLANPKVQQLVMFIPLFIICLSLHEYAHAWVAQKLGDPTAKYLGRLTMDPMAHISILGTIVFPAIGLLSGGFLFGWANPVPIDPRHFKKPRQGMALVAAAGPASNVLIAILVAAVFGLVTRFVPVEKFTEETSLWGAVLKMSVMAMQLNLFLAFFNLIPIPPLDGSRILAGLVGEKWAVEIDKLERMGFWILLILMYTGALRFLAGFVLGFQEILFRVFT
jgi:Zn-dependent protease